jgi:hypothetical protein
MPRESGASSDCSRRDKPEKAESTGSSAFADDDDCGYAALLAAGIASTA